MLSSRFLRPAAIVALPLLCLAGCGGGATNSPAPRPTTTPTLVPSPRFISPTTESINDQQFELRNGQLITFNLQTYAGETRISGSGTIAGYGPPGSPLPGRLGLTGERTGAREFEAQVDGSLFFLKARLATATEAGSFTFLTLDSSESGTIAPTAQVRPTPTPPPQVAPAEAQVTLTASSDSNYKAVPLQGAFVARTSTTTLDLGIFGNGGAFGSSTSLAFDGLTLRVGAKLDAAIGRPFYLQNSEYRGESRNYQARSGEITVTALSGNTATIQLKNLVYTPAAPFNATPNPATGTLTLNGTVTGQF